MRQCICLILSQELGLGFRRELPSHSPTTPNSNSNWNLSESRCHHIGALWNLRQNFLPSPWQQADVSERVAAPLTTQAKAFLRRCSQALTRKP